MERIKNFYYEKITDFLSNRNLNLLDSFLERIIIGKPKKYYVVEQYQLLKEGEEQTIKPNLIVTKSWYKCYKAMYKHSEVYGETECLWIDTQEELNEILTNTYKPNSINIIII